MYWADKLTGAILSAPLGVANPPIRTVATATGATSLVVYGSQIFFTSSSPYNVLGVVPVTGLTYGMTFTEALPTSTCITTDGINLYWGYGDGLTGSIEQYPLAGTGHPVIISTGADTRQPAGVAVDGSNVYWGDSVIPKLYSAPLGGGIPKLVVNATALDLAVDSTGLYFVSGTYGVVAKVTPK